MDSIIAKRRIFLRKTIFILSGFCTYLLGGINIIPNKNFIFKVTMKYNKPIFDIEQRPWENSSSFAEINSKYYQQGKILSLKKKVYKEQRIVEWTYVFNSEESFLIWDKEVIDTSTFQSQLIPSDIEYLFEVQKQS